MWDGIKARVVEDLSDFVNQNVRLVLYQRVLGSQAVLTGDGRWASVEEGAALPDEVGIVLPKEAVEAIRVAIEQYQGAAGNPRTESSVLREWLAVERARVDEALRR